MEHFFFLRPIKTSLYKSQQVSIISTILCAAHIIHKYLHSCEISELVCCDVYTDVNNSTGNTWFQLVSKISVRYLLEARN